MITALLLTFTIPIVGLAIDAGVLYVIRARVSAACDAASLATARSLHLGNTLSEQIANATARGQAFFTANFPAGTYGTSTVVPTVSIDQSNANVLRVTTTASGTVPLYFLRFLGINGQMAGASGTAARRDVNLILVLDRSGSMRGDPCVKMRTAATTFVDMFMEGRDRLSVVTFGASVASNLPPTSAFKTGATTATSVINQVDCGSWTNTSDAYWTAYQQLVAISQPLALNVIVFFTDGVPTALSANLPIRTQTSSISGTTYGPSTCADDSGRASGDASWGQPFQNGLPFIAPKLGVWAYGNGMYNPVTTGFSTNDPIVVAAGCSFTSDRSNLWRDVAFLPETDRNGASTSGAKPLIRFPTGHPYEGRIATGEDANDVAVTWNAADNAAAAARADTTLNPVTYTIGLGSNGGVDDDLLRRMANDAASTSFNPARPVGRYVFAATADDLNRAFSEVASDTLRLVR